MVLAADDMADAEFGIADDHAYGRALRVR